MPEAELGHCHTLSFRIEVPSGTALIASLPHWTNAAIARQAESILDPYLVAELIEHRTSRRISPVVVPPKRDGSIAITASYELLNAARVVGNWPLPCTYGTTNSLGKGKIFSPSRLVAGPYQNAIHPDSIGDLYHTARPLFVFKNDQGTHFPSVPRCV